MELKIVKSPYQNNSIYGEKEYVTHTIESNLKGNFLTKNIPYWCVKTYQYKESDGGINLWFKMLKNINPKIIYFFDIKTIIENNETYYLIRADIKN